MAVIREEMVLADRFSATFNRYLGMLRQSSSASTAATAGQRQFEAASGKTQDGRGRPWTRPPPWAGWTRAPHRRLPPESKRPGLRTK